jgi:hypothetical protein
MRQETKKIAVATEAPSVNGVFMLTSAPWYYAGIQYGDHRMGLLVACNSDIGIGFMYHEACLKESFA